MKTTVNKKKQIVGFFYGLAAGLAFSIFAWGMDGFFLAKAHGAYPWVKFIPGMLIAMVPGALVGWLTSRMQNHLAGLVLWLAYSLLLSWLIIWLPIKATPYLIGISNNFLGNYLDYPFYTDTSQIRWFGFAIVAFAAIICELIENILIDQAMFSTGKIAFGIPILISFICFSMAGNVTDGLYNRHIREPIQKVDELIQFAVENQGTEISPEVKRKMHLAALEPFEKILPRERKLILSNYDRDFGQVDVLINFDGYYVKCTTIYNQVTYCKEALDITRSFLSNHTFLAVDISNSWILPDA
jgi:hypothetical protein